MLQLPMNKRQLCMLFVSMPPLLMRREMWFELFVCVGRKRNIYNDGFGFREIGTNARVSLFVPLGGYFTVLLYGIM